MMLSLNQVDVIPANTLQPGDFAILNDMDDTPVLISIPKDGDQAHALLLNQSTGVVETNFTGNLQGLATRVAVFEIEIDPRTGNRDAGIAGNSLVREGAMLACRINEGGKFASFKIAEYPALSESGRVYYTRWRIVVPVGIERRVLVTIEPK
jgi:hypothetical protein